MADKKISELNSAASLLLSDIFPTVNDGETKKATFETLKTLLEKNLIGGGTITLPAGTGLSNADAGKLIQNKEGQAFVSARDTPVPGQAGQWIVTFTDAPAAPTPSVYTFEFVGIPVEGEWIEFGTKRFIFSSSDLGRNFVLIGATTQDCAFNLYTKAIATPYSGQVFTAEDESVNSKVRFIFNPYNRNKMGRMDGNSELFAPEINSTTTVESCSLAVVPTRVVDGQDTFLFNNGGIHGDWFVGVFQLRLSDITNIATAPNGQVIFFEKWAATKEEWAENFEAAMAAKYPTEFSVSRVDEVVTITALVAPNAPATSDLIISNDAYGCIEVETVQSNLSPFIDSLDAPIIGQLLFVSDGVAYISTSHTIKIKLDGANNSNCWLSAGTVEQAYSRILVPSADGNLETLISYATDIGGNVSPDILRMVGLFTNVYMAKSAVAPGELVIAEKVSGAELSILLQFLGG